MCTATATACWIGGCGHWKLAWYLHTHYDKHTCTCLRTGYTTHRQTHTHTLWWIHSQNILERNQLHVQCRPYAGWPFGLALPIDWKHVMWLLEKAVPTRLMSACQTETWPIECLTVFKLQNRAGNFRYPLTAGGYLQLHFCKASIIVANRYLPSNSSFSDCFVSPLDNNCTIVLLNKLLELQLARFKSGYKTTRPTALRWPSKVAVHLSW